MEAECCSLGVRRDDENEVVIMNTSMSYLAFSFFMISFFFSSVISMSFSVLSLKK